jgi:hypothetical protein
MWSSWPCGFRGSFGGLNALPKVPCQETQRILHSLFAVIVVVLRMTGRPDGTMELRQDALHSAAFPACALHFAQALDAL